MQRSTKMFPNLPLSQRGTVQCLEIDSMALKDNPWGDPSHRDIWVYTFYFGWRKCEFFRREPYGLFRGRTVS